MKKELEIIRKAMEQISVRGRQDIELMGMCMDALDEQIAKCESEEESDG